MDLKRIAKLDDDVVAKIAAGEIILRPVNCVKELIENSLDAGATVIQITIKGGGFDLIKVQDDGHGITKEDLNMVCERFATSKLSQIEDLSTMATYGFRGEALSSMSTVSRVTIVTKTKDDICGHKVQYSSGSVDGEIQKLAATQGTTITVEDLFYNMPMRRNAFKSNAGEFNQILDLVTKHAIHYSNSVSFLLRKDDKEADIATNAPAQTVANIKLLYGNEVGRDVAALCSDNDQDAKYSMSGIISKPNVSLKKFQFLLFINDRLVECSTLKKAIDTVYEDYLSKGSHPFVYLNLRIAPENLDINIHPSKNEVRYLNEDAINADIVKAIKLKLDRNDEMPCSLTKLKEKSKIVKSGSGQKERPKDRSLRPSEIIRTNPSSRKIDEMWTQQNYRNKVGKNSRNREIRLASVKNLRTACERVMDPDLREIFRKSSFVGCVSESLFLIQNEERMLLVDLKQLSKELFYQAFLKDFGNFGSLKFKTPLPIREVARIYNDYMSAKVDENEAYNLLVSQREMLDDYFALTIDENGLITGLPLIVDGHQPNFNLLPQLIHDLVKNVSWKIEQECFESLGRVLADFYAHPPDASSDDPDFAEWKNTVGYVIYPFAKRFLKPPTTLKSCLKVATNLPTLYKVFERC